jgi:hypothetical protein
MPFYCCKYCILNILHIRAFVIIDFQGSLGKIIRFSADFHLSERFQQSNSVCLVGREDSESSAEPSESKY